MTNQDTLLTRARALIGSPATPPATARDAVNQPMIRRWCEAMGETNPIYHDADAARAAGHPGIVAPPAMMEVWTMSPYKPGGRTVDEGMAVLGLFDEAGFSGVVATNIEQEYDRYLVEGDIVSFQAVVADVSEEKQTGLGTGHFVTVRYEFTDQHNAPVGRMVFRLLKFKPPVQQDTAPAHDDGGLKKFPHPRPAITHDNAFYWEGLNNRKLLIQSCKSCNTLRHPPGPMCPKCQSLEWTTVEASGKGTVHSFVVMHQPQMPGMDYPLPILLVELAEGTRLVANVLDANPKDIAIGDPVSLEFVEVEPGYILPAFRLIKGAA